MNTDMHVGEKRQDGLLHLYVGTGKGKSTAAAGLALRAIGHGEKVLFAQFLKGTPSGEVTAFSQWHSLVEVRRPFMRHNAFLWHQTPQEKEETFEDVRSGWQSLKACMLDPAYRVYVFDELLDVVEMGIVNETEVVRALAARHARAEVVLTGRHASVALEEMADYVTEMTLRKHPFDRCVPARRGIEW